MESSRDSLQRPAPGLPDGTSICRTFRPGKPRRADPGLEYMLSAFPLGEAIEMIFTGSGECAEVSRSFLSLSIPAWALVWFVLLGAVSLANNFRTPPGFRPRLFD